MPTQPRGILAALILIQVLFGIHYYTLKLVLIDFPPLVWASFRCAMAALGFAALAWRAGELFPLPSPRVLGQAAVLSVLGIAANQVTFVAGLKYTTATHSAVLNALIPIFTLVFATAAGIERLNSRKFLGVGGAFIGVLLLVDIGHFRWGQGTALGDALTLFNTLSYSAFLILGKPFVERHSKLKATFWLFFFGSLILFAIALPQWWHFQWPPFSWRLVAAASYTILGATIAAYWLLNYTLARVPSSRLASFIYLQPVIAAILAVAFLGEKLTDRVFWKSALIFLGVFLSQGISNSTSKGK